MLWSSELEDMISNLQKLQEMLAAVSLKTGMLDSMESKNRHPRWQWSFCFQNSRKYRMKQAYVLRD